MRTLPSFLCHLYLLGLLTSMATKWQGRGHSLPLINHSQTFFGHQENHRANVVPAPEAHPAGMGAGRVVSGKLRWVQATEGHIMGRKAWRGAQQDETAVCLPSGLCHCISNFTSLWLVFANLQSLGNPSVFHGHYVLLQKFSLD